MSDDEPGVTVRIHLPDDALDRLDAGGTVETTVDVTAVEDVLCIDITTDSDNDDDDESGFRVDDTLY